MYNCAQRVLRTTAMQQNLRTNAGFKKIIFLVIAIFVSAGIFAQLPLIKISENKRFFRTVDNKPFFWLGDTGWLLFKKCKKEEAIIYLDNRKQKGFNVIQVMVLHELNITDAYGDSALINKNIATPNISGKFNYWDNISFVIDEAAKRGIYIALVPIWGGNIKHVSLEQVKTYAAFLANRYKNKSNIIWLNGGDIKGGDALDKWNAIGNTIKSIDHNHLMGFHPRGRNSSSAWFHNEPWLDFNMFQSGHKSYAQDTSSSETFHYGEDNWRYVNDDYILKPTKPTFDGEPSYENIPHGLHDSAEKRWTAADVRRYAYWSVFAGGCGFTYGNNSVMQFYRIGERDRSFGANKSWENELNVPGAGEMQFLKKLMLRESYFDRKPAQELVADDGQQYYKIMATKGKDFALFYTYTGRKFTVKMNELHFNNVKASWFNPIDGATKKIFEIRKYESSRVFTPPTKSDWVLILEQK